MKIVAGGGEKRAKFWAPVEGCPAEGRKWGVGSGFSSFRFWDENRNKTKTK